MIGSVPQDECLCVLEGNQIQGGSLKDATTPESALAFLKKLTKVDFGYDTVAWRKWFRENEPDTARWFRMSADEKYIAVIEKRPSMQIFAWQMTNEEARQQLIKLTGQDFGYDGAAWRQWYWQHRSELAKCFVYG